MFRQLAKLAQPVRLSEPSDSDDGPIVGERVAATAPLAKSPSPATSPLAQRDLRVSFNLLYQAIIRFSDPRPKAGQMLVDARALEDMRQKLIAQESERLQLKSDLEYAHECAHSYWDRCKSLEAELNQLKGGSVVNLISRARSTRGLT